MRGSPTVIALLLACLSLLPATGALADDRLAHGDWSSQFLEDMGEASTHENGLSVFGMLCAKNVCRYYFANGLDCDAGLKYPLMLTTRSGALSIEATCEPMSTANGDVMLYWFDESARLNDAFATSPELGIAFPLTNGQFRNSKFSMKGYEEAIERMVNGMRARREASENPDSKDRT